MTRVMPDAEALLVAFFTPLVTPTHVGTLIPKTRPARFVRVWRTGGAALNRVIDRPQMTIKATVKGDKEAARELAQTLRTALFDGYTAIRGVGTVEEIAGLYYDPDPTTGDPAYTFTVALSVAARRP